MSKPVRQTKTIVITYIFVSSSNCDKKYQTLLYTDGTTSCDCPGWTFKGKVDAGGNRSCKHTRLVQAGLADDQCQKKVDHRNNGSAPLPINQPEPETAPLDFIGGRRFDFTV